METPITTSAAPRELPILGGHLALDFANTVDDPLGAARHDHVATYPDLLRWATRVAVIDQHRQTQLLHAAARDPQAEVAVLRRAHGLREILNSLFGSVADHRAELTTEWPRLRPFVTEAVAAASLTTVDETDRARQTVPRHEWTWPHTDELAVVLHPIAMAATDLLVGPDLPRLKRCARCPWLFLDQSKNGSRRWCNMDDCGRAEKIERYVARRAARRSSGERATR